MNDRRLTQIRWLVSKMPPSRVRAIRPNGDYLTRVYLTGMPKMPDGSHPFTDDGVTRKGAIWPRGVSVHLHNILSPDPEDGWLHNHPWKWAYSLILTGGYSEEFRVNESFVAFRKLLPGDINVIGRDTFHRITEVAPDTWTLFIAWSDGGEGHSWGFWERETGKLETWQEHLRVEKGST